jgi:hypothetical protein
MDFGAAPNLLFPRSVRIAIENYKAAFVGAAAIHVTGGLLKPFADQRL